MPGTRDRKPFVLAQAAKGRIYLYYRRDGRRIPLPGPEGSAAFLRRYDEVHAEFEAPSSAEFGRHTLGAAIDAYLAGADFRSLAPASQRHYRLYLDELRDRSGRVALSLVDAAWVDGLRDRLSDDPHRWNRIRSLMRVVCRLYSRAHPGVVVDGAWRDSATISTPQSRQNRPWPDDVLLQVLREATPEFRALLTCLLLSSQRIGDVCRWPDTCYDPAEGLLRFTQGKTSQPMVLRLPAAMASALDAMRGRVRGRLLATPRGRAWDPGNAEETLLSMRNRLGLDRYTLHGLRGTGASALVMLGYAPHQVITLTGHTDTKALRPYLQGVDKVELSRPLQEALAGRYADVLTTASDGANSRRFSGRTGRAAAKAGVVGASRGVSNQSKTQNPAPSGREKR